MAIRVVMPEDGQFSVQYMFNMIDFVTTRAVVTSLTSSSFSGGGTFEGASGNFDATGSGFSLGLLYGEPYIIAGTLTNLDFWAGPFTSEDNVLAVSSLDIDMAVFGPIIANDEHGFDTLGIENFLLSKQWDIVLGNGDDIAPKGISVGDGATFNLLGDDTVHGMGGNDNLYTGDGDDSLYGDSGNDRLDGGIGADLVNGGSGRDRLYGSAGNDELVGGAGRDILRGGTGKDELNGGKGNDVLIGGGGADLFVFRSNAGHDTINDFNALSNKEDIDLSAVKSIKSFRDLKNNHMSQDGENVIINDGANTVIELIGIDMADLGKGDFLF